MHLQTQLLDQQGMPLLVGFDFTDFTDSKEHNQDADEDTDQDFSINKRRPVMETGLLVQTGLSASFWAALADLGDFFLSL